MKYQWHKIIINGGWSFALALMTLGLWLWISSFPIPFTGEVSILKYVSYAKELVESHSDEEVSYLENASFINIAYDKDLVVINDEFGFPKGHYPITDRYALLRFLKLAHQFPSYHQIILDVYFDPSLSTEWDDSLYQLIVTTPRIHIPKHNDAALPSEILSSVVSFSDYYTTSEQNDFMKYPLFSDKEMTLALKMWSDSLKKPCHFGRLMGYTEDRLIIKSIIPSLRIPHLPEYTDNGEKIIFNLTTDILEPNEPYIYESIFNNKDIIIGDLTENDMHNTFRGSMPGPLIHYNTYIDLLHGRHLFSMWFVFVILVSFWILSFDTIYGISFDKYFSRYKWLIHNKLTRIMSQWISYSAILTIVSILAFLIFNTVFDVFITATIFTLYNQIFSIYKKHGTKIINTLAIIDF